MADKLPDVINVGVNESSTNLVGIEIAPAEEYVIPEFRIEPFELSGSVDLLGLVLEEDVILPDLSADKSGEKAARDELFQRIEIGDPTLVCERVSITRGVVTDIHVNVEGNCFWDNLSPSVVIDSEVSTTTRWASLYNLEVPFAVVQVGPQCIAPVFNACVEGVCNCRYVLCGAVCQLKPCRFAAAVLGFGWDVTRDDLFVVTAAYRGASIVDKNCQCEYECENYSTITGAKFSAEMTKKVEDEIREEKVRVVYDRPKCVHALGGVEKSNGKLRPVTDCSQPEGCSINEFMSTTCEKFHYKNIDTVVGMLWPMDHGAVSDIASAYRTIHVKPNHRTFQGLKWCLKGRMEYIEDLRLCFGLRSAPFIFTQFSDFLVKCCEKLGTTRCVNYLDDFVVLGASVDECAEAQSTLHRVLVNFGFDLAQEKVLPPSRVFKYLGIVIDSIKMTVSIDDDKLKRVKVGVAELLDKKSCKRKTLEEVAGLLAHCATVVKGGRTFARRIYNSLKCNVGERVELDEIIQQDLIWWSSFVHWFNGKAKVLGAERVTIPVYTDSSSYGFGGHITEDYFWGVWKEMALGCPHSEDSPREAYEDHINITELWPVVVAIHRWGASWRNLDVLVVTDNTQVQGWVNSGRSCNPYAMAWLRELFWVAAFFNINVRACRITSGDNVWADALSRLNNPDCLFICEHDIQGFSDCCRAARAASGVVGDQGHVLVGQHVEGA